MNIVIPILETSSAEHKKIPARTKISPRPGSGKRPGQAFDHLEIMKNFTATSFVRAVRNLLQPSARGSLTVFAPLRFEHGFGFQAGARKKPAPTGFSSFVGVG